MALRTAIQNFSRYFSPPRETLLPVRSYLMRGMQEIDDAYSHCALWRWDLLGPPSSRSGRRPFQSRARPGGDRPRHGDVGSGGKGWSYGIAFRAAVDHDGLYDPCIEGRPERNHGAHRTDGGCR